MRSTRGSPPAIRSPSSSPNVCTFAYRGPVVSVQLVHFGVGLPDDLSFEQLGDREWWVLALAIPDGTRLEYKLDVVDSFGKHFIDDPLNPHLASHPFGVNSVCESWGYVKPLWARHADDVPAGTFTDITRLERRVRQGHQRDRLPLGHRRRAGPADRRPRRR